MFEDHCRCPGCGTCGAHNELEILKQIVKAADELRLDFIEGTPIPEAIAKYDKERVKWRKNSG